MIVKVQISLFTTEKKPQVLIYDEERSFEFTGDAPDELIEQMAGEPKVFFHANIDRWGLLHLKEQAKWQEW